MKKVDQQDCYYLYRLGVLRLKRMHGLRQVMPKVGKKEFAYTPKGMAMAKAEAKKTGKSMKMKGKKKK
jgi:hypothetical protein